MNKEEYAEEHNPEEREPEMSRYDPRANGFSSLEDFNRWRI